ncbi:hypothetical protein DFP72DRAFT_861415 [Ephemerocybe angulata]|uniref:Uncharacterized protein n=1 Tax=Ephemerocybe angulata TaxID=980116 RepID=A0A8H6H9K0_9AGAR|nr:hypothetical protein DFP72DRAFT_861415 [Tulosesus angulatus]
MPRHANGVRDTSFGKTTRLSDRSEAGSGSSWFARGRRWGLLAWLSLPLGVPCWMYERLASFDVTIYPSKPSNASDSGADGSSFGRWNLVEWGHASGFVRKVISSFNASYTGYALSFDSSSPPPFYVFVIEPGNFPPRQWPRYTRSQDDITAFHIILLTMRTYAQNHPACAPLIPRKIQVLDDQNVDEPLTRDNPTKSILTVWHEYCNIISETGPKPWYISDPIE